MPVQQREPSSSRETGFRVDVATHELLTSGPKPAPLVPCGEPLTRPERVFPQFLEKLGDVESAQSRGGQYQNAFRSTPVPLLAGVGAAKGAAPTRDLGCHRSAACS